MATFVRKHPGHGTYQAAYKENSDGSIEHIKIEGRDYYETDNKKIIEFLREDPEVEEVDKSTLIEPLNDEENEGGEE